MRVTRRRRIDVAYLVCGAALSAIALHTPCAAAQGLPSSAAPTAGKLGPSSAQPGPTDAAPSNQVGEVVVTAQKRSENIQKTPLSVTAVSAQQLKTQHVEELADIGAVAPGVQLVTIAETVQVNARGIGSNFFDPRAQSSIAQSIDGLYYTRPPQSGSTFFDLSRIEVLKGPQGTLYGTNSAGGAVNLVSNQPVDHYEGYLEAGFGNYNQREYAVTLNVPVTDDLAIRIAGKGLFHDGYVANYYDDADDNAVRASVKWTPFHNFTAYLAYNYAEYNGHSATPVSYPCDSTPYSNVVSAACAPPGAPGGAYPLTGHGTTNLQTLQLNLTYDLGWATLTSITGRLTQKVTESGVPNGTFFISDLNQASDDTSEEFRIAGNGTANHAGGFSWLVGGYYSGGGGSQFFQALGPPAVLTNLPETTYAVFTQETYGITDRIRATAGVRYTHDDRGVVDVNGSNLNVPADHVNFRFEAEGDLARNSLLYASVSSGYVAGGGNGGFSNQPLATGVIPTTFKPERIISYELGSKNTFFDRRLLINGDFFYYSVRNFQSYDPGFLNNGVGPDLEIQNIGNADIYGGEVDGAFVLTPEDRFTFSGSLSHGTYGPLNLDEFAPAPSPTGFGPTLISVPAGYPVTNLPPWDTHLGYSHRWRLPGGDSLEGAVNAHITWPYWTVPASTDGLDKQKSFSDTDLDLRYTAANGLGVLLYVSNIENNAVTTYGEDPGFHLYYPSPPRTYGMTVSYSFR